MSPPLAPSTATLTPSRSLSPLPPHPPTLSLHRHSPRFTLPFITTTTTKPLTQTKTRPRHVSLRPLKSVDNTKQTANTSPEEKQEEQSQSPRPPSQPEEEEPTAAEAVGKEVRRLMEEREGEGWWSGVVEEVREIEWPVFGKVLGTTGVVLAIIAGSSVVLLTVNAVLALLSDSVFAGRGVLDFLG